MSKDWIGNARSAFTCNGASNHSENERETNDYYATEPKAIDVLVLEGGAKINGKVWECSCGEGHLSKRLQELGYSVESSDLIERGYGQGGIDFLRQQGMYKGCSNILTNPPYKYAKEFVEHALDILPDGGKCFMFLKLTFLEGKARKEMFKKYPPKAVYVSSSRLQCAMNGDFETYCKGANTAVAYAWYEWEKGYKGETVIKWIN